jgi:hypothetical protein
VRILTQRTIDEYILSLGRIRHERLYARLRADVLYVLTDLPPSTLGYTIPAPQRDVQRTIDGYLDCHDATIHHDNYQRRY